MEKSLIWQQTYSRKWKNLYSEAAVILFMFCFGFLLN